MRRLALLLGLLLAACTAQSADSNVLIAEPVAVLDPGQPAQTRFGALEFRGGLRLRSGAAGFGGWSAARLDGDRLTAVNDVGDWMELRLAWAGGRLAEAQRIGGGSLRGLDGAPLGDRKKLADAEGLARWNGGDVVSFERRHRLWHYVPDLSARPTQLEPPADIARLDANGGLEAIVTLADGRLLLLAEEGGIGWIGKPGAWHRVTWAQTGDFKPTDAALLPSGAVLVLERRFSLLGGVGTRLSLVSPADLRPGARLQGRELLRLAQPAVIDNFEALAVGRGADGETIVYLLSDDNFSSLQTTLLLAFEVTSQP